MRNVVRPEWDVSAEWRAQSPRQELHLTGSGSKRGGRFHGEFHTPPASKTRNRAVISGRGGMEEEGPDSAAMWPPNCSSGHNNKSMQTRYTTAMCRGKLGSTAKIAIVRLQVILLLHHPLTPRHRRAQREIVMKRRKFRSRIISIYPPPPLK